MKWWDTLILYMKITERKEYGKRVIKFLCSIERNSNHSRSSDIPNIFTHYPPVTLFSVSDRSILNVPRQLCFSLPNCDRENIRFPSTSFFFFCKSFCFISTRSPISRTAIQLINDWFNLDYGKSEVCLKVIGDSASSSGWESFSPLIQRKLSWEYLSANFN